MDSKAERKRRTGQLTPVPQGEGGYDECWYPVAMSSELGPNEVLGRELFDGRVVIFRTSSGEASVVSAYCRHMGADLSDGKVVDDCLRCPFHHWSFDTSGTCVKTAVGDSVPPSGVPVSSLAAAKSRSRASWLPFGCQNRSSTTTATRATSEAMMSVSSTEM